MGGWGKESGGQLVHRHARRGDLRPRRAAELDQLAVRVDNRDHDALTARDRALLGGGDDGGGAGVVDDPACSDESHTEQSRAERVRYDST
jgi:hypothetical protein